MSEPWAPGGANEWPPVLGESVTMPSGAYVPAYSWAEDHDGRRVNDVQVWARPVADPAAVEPRTVYAPGVEPTSGS